MQRLSCTQFHDGRADFAAASCRCHGYWAFTLLRDRQDHVGQTSSTTSTGRIPAVENGHLDMIARRYLPVIVANATLVGNGTPVNILWQVNAQTTGGCVIELSSEWGVKKAECDTMKLDPAGTVRATLLLMKEARGATEWVSNSAIRNGSLPVGTTLVVDVPPGNTSFVAFGAATTRVQK